MVNSDHKPSILVDQELGRPLETGALFTLPLNLARMAGVRTPMLDLLTALSLQAVASARTERTPKLGAVP
jgi:ketopantoate reductase